MSAPTESTGHGSLKAGVVGGCVTALSALSLYLLLRVAGEEPFLKFRMGDLATFVVIPVVFSVLWLGLAGAVAVPRAATVIGLGPTARFALLLLSLGGLCATTLVPISYAQDLERFACASSDEHEMLLLRRVAETCKAACVPEMQERPPSGTRE